MDRNRQYTSTASITSSFVVLSEANPKGKTISSPCNRDGYTAEISFCTLQKGLYLARQAPHTHQCTGCLWASAVRERFYTSKNNLHLSSNFTLTNSGRQMDNAPGFSSEVAVLFCITGPKDLLYFLT